VDLYRHRVVALTILRHSFIFPEQVKTKKKNKKTSQDKPTKFLLTNKIKEVSFKLLHRFYPTNVCLNTFKNDIDVKCSFCAPETISHLFWSCEFT